MLSVASYHWKRKTPYCDYHQQGFNMASKQKTRTSKEQPSRGNAGRGSLSYRSSGPDNIFSQIAEELKKDGFDSESSDDSAADPNDVIKTMKDMDDMDADLFASVKSKAAPAQTKPFGNDGAKKESSVGGSNNAKPAGADEPTRGRTKANTAPLSAARSLKKSPHSEVDDLLNDSLDDLPDETKPESKPRPTSSEKSADRLSASPILKRDTLKETKKSELDDNNDDVMTSLWSSKERSDPPPRIRTRIDDILERSTPPRLLERPATGERKDHPQEKQQNGKETLLGEDVAFGSYQPTITSTPEGRQSRRQSVRFSTEDLKPSTPENKSSKPTPLTSARRSTSADWLGLKPNEEVSTQEDEAQQPKLPLESPPALERKPSLTDLTKTATSDIATDPTTAEGSKSQQKEEDHEEEDDWLAGALSRKKALFGSTIEAKIIKQEDSTMVEKVDLNSTVGKKVRSHDRRTKTDSVSSPQGTSLAAFGRPSSAALSTPFRETDKQVPPQSAASTAQQQAPFSADSLQQLLIQQQMMQTQLLTQGGVLDASALPKFKEIEAQSGDYQVLQARIIQLEGQVKMLQLERAQTQMTLDNIQQRHKQDMELLENTHKARVKMLEDSASQRETRALRECEDLMERLDEVTRSAEQERTELQAQYQRKLGQAQQDRDREVERLRDLQRKSVLEMKKDHEDQVQRLKKLKEEEIDAVTSATTQTRSLVGVIEQMEQFSSRLGELSSRVESTHEHTAQGLEQGARHRDEQLRTMQKRLAEQQKAMTEEKAYLKEIISRMDSQLNEQQRQLEKERWKMTAEQAKAESAQRGLEEERRTLSMQISMEREELERAKSTLLEEQKSVMQHCADERRKLAAEWAQFHTQEKQRHERVEREVSSLIEKREGSIISLAQEQADLKLRTAELKQQERTVTQERDALDRLRETLDREKERISSTALKLKTRAQEVEAFSKLAAEKYEEGERAIQEAKHIEAEHEARLRNIHTKTEHLRKQEQRVLKERMQLNHLQEDTNRPTHDPAVPLLPPPLINTPSFPSDLKPSSSAFGKILQAPPPLNSQSMTLQASLALWRYTAEKDREYLHEEQMFLENLKKSNRSFFHTD